MLFSQPWIVIFSVICLMAGCLAAVGEISDVQLAWIGMSNGAVLLALGKESCKVVVRGMSRWYIPFQMFAK